MISRFSEAHDLDSSIKSESGKQFDIKAVYQSFGLKSESRREGNSERENESESDLKQNIGTNPAHLMKCESE